MTSVQRIQEPVPRGTGSFFANKNAGTVPGPFYLYFVYGLYILYIVTYILYILPGGGRDMREGSANRIFTFY
jgi:hypothetical protein